jgi:CUB/sushi domain-containing protein
VKLLATSCPEELSRGNVLAWPDFLWGIEGKVKIDYKSIFCSGENFLLAWTLPSLGVF